MKGQTTLFSKKTDDWKTPTKIYNHFINKLGCIDCFKYESKEDEILIFTRNKYHTYYQINQRQIEL